MIRSVPAAAEYPERPVTAIVGSSSASSRSIPRR